MLVPFEIVTPLLVVEHVVEAEADDHALAGLCIVELLFLVSGQAVDAELAAEFDLLGDEELPVKVADGIVVVGFDYIIQLLHLSIQPLQFCLATKLLMELKILLDSCEH